MQGRSVWKVKSYYTVLPNNLLQVDGSPLLGDVGWWREDKWAMTGVEVLDLSCIHTPARTFRSQKYDGIYKIMSKRIHSFMPFHATTVCDRKTTLHIYHRTTPRSGLQSVLRPHYPILISEFLIANWPSARWGLLSDSKEFVAFVVVDPPNSLNLGYNKKRKRFWIRFIPTLHW